MEEVIEAIVTKLESNATLKYASEDWGQLDYYSTNFPVKFPCALVDISNAGFANLGIDKTASPKNRQTATASVTITLANVRLTNSSGRAPQTQRNNAFNIWALQGEIHALLQGWKPTANTGALIRSGLQRIKRDDGVQEYVVVYDLSFANI